MSDKPTMHCNFCGKSQHEVEVLIAGPGGVNICETCVDMCAHLVSQNRSKARAHLADIRDNGT